MHQASSITRSGILEAESTHRWFNILQMLSALVRLRIRRCHSPEARAQLAWTLQALSTIARLQRGLDDAGLTGLHAHLQDQAMLWSQIGREQGIAVEVDLDPAVVMPKGEAAPMALIVQELMANGFEHAFPSGQVGAIRLSSRRHDDGSQTITVADDGQGLRGYEMSDCLPRSGLKIARSLAEAIGAELTICMGEPAGTVARVLVPCPPCDHADRTEPLRR